MTTILGISGSTRKRSFNSALLRAAVELAPAGVTIEIASIADIPLYNGDVEEAGIPAPVTELKERIAKSDGLLLVSPEYNHSVPGVLKNAIDWLSRPPADIQRVFGNRPVAMAGATEGPGGTALGQVAWLPVLQNLGMRAYFGPWTKVANAKTAFDAELKLTDEKAKKQLVKMLEGFAGFIQKR